MAEQPGIKVEKPVSALQKDIKVKPKELLTSLGKATINGLFLKWDDLAENGLEVLTSLGLEAKPGEIAGLLIVRSLIQAMQSLLKSNKELLVRQPDSLKELYDELNSSLVNDELVIDQDFFQHPKNLPIVQAAKTAFAKWLEEFVEHKVEARNISNRLPAYFVFALNDQWVTRSGEYISLAEVLDTPFTQATRREQGWARYRARLQEQAEEPMFLEAFSLKQVYVPLRAYYEREVERQRDKRSGSTEEKKYERVVVDLTNELENWLYEAKPDDAVRIISGGPGSGKSSFTKIFAAQWAEGEDIGILFIPLHLLSLSDDLVKAVGDFVKIQDFLHHNPLDREHGEARLIIVFDGLDELSMQGKVAEEAAKQFVDEVRDKVRQFNHHETRLQVLISGRELVVQANRTKFREPHQILHILPYFLSDEEINEENFIDKKKLLEQDQRQIWWQLYGKAKDKEYEGLPEDLDRESLVEITTQPLLNYLVALSIERDKLRFSEETNLNEIYDDLLEAVYERGYEKHGYRLTEGIEKEEFIGILEEIALACWHGDGRTSTVREIESHCDSSGLKNILCRFKESFNEDSKASVNRLLTAFYFRESGGVRESEKTFEFTHKSFGEYLAAKRIVLGIRLIHEDLEERKKNFRKGCDERAALLTWTALCGPSPIDEYLFQFILDEIRLQNLIDITGWQKTLCRLIESMLANGMPMEILKLPDFQAETKQARNAEEALLALLNACARVTRNISGIRWASRGAFGTWISRLGGQRTEESSQVLVFECLGFLDLMECSLLYKDLYVGNLYRANLVEANLEGANLEGANLEGANLYRANLYRANLVEANLVEANLEEATLDRANLDEATLYRANLFGANLVEATLDRANLDEATLNDATLDRATFEGATLEGANFFGATLEGANFEEANLEGANLEGANLEGANFFGANLEGANLEGANLEGANFFGANLFGANFFEANLFGANLNRANLVAANFFGANLDDANLEGAILDRTTLKGELPNEEA